MDNDFSVPKVTAFSTQSSLNYRGRLLDTGSPLVMGILNLTPDSFYSGSRYGSERDILEGAGKLLEEGADIIDIGGASSRPGAKPVSEDEETKRVVPAIELVHKHYPGAVISVDTYRSSVAEKAVDKGAGIINDISGGEMDPAMFAVAARLKTPYVLMHMKGSPFTMQQNPQYDNLVVEVSDFFARKITLLLEAGVYDVILDPGFGFGKTIAHNMELLQNLSYFSIFELPVMIGLSRKSTIYKLLGTSPDEALNGTTVLHTIALLNGVSVLRVHDVREAREAITLVNACRKHAG